MKEQQAVIEEEMLEIDLREYIVLLWAKKWLIIILVVIAAVVGYFYSQQMTRIYQTSTLVMVKEDSGVSDIFSSQFSFVSGGGNKIANYTEIIKSRNILKKVITELNLRDEESAELISPESLRDSISINGNRDTNLINITVTYKDPVIARDIANKLVEVFINENQDLNRTDLKNASEFINTQLAKVQEELAVLEQNMLEFKEENQVILPDENMKNTLNRLTQLESNRTEALFELEEARLSLNEYRAYLEKEEQQIVSSKTISSNPLITQNRSRLVELEIKLAGLREIYTEKHPEVIRVKREMEELNKSLESQVSELVSSRSETRNPLYQNLRERVITLENSIITAEARITALDDLIASITEELGKLPEKELELTRFQREARVAENLYTILMEKRSELQIQEAMQSSDIAVIDPAVVKETPIKPRVKLNVLIAVFLAAILAVFIIFFMEYMDNRIKEEKDIERLTGLPVLGVIPNFDRVDHDRGYGGDDKSV